MGNSAIAQYLPHEECTSSEMRLAISEAAMWNRDVFDQSLTIGVGTLKITDEYPFDSGRQVVWELEECTFQEELKFEKRQDKRWRQKHQRSVQPQKTCARKGEMLRHL